MQGNDSTDFSTNGTLIYIGESVLGLIHSKIAMFRRNVAPQELTRKESMESLRQDSAIGSDLGVSLPRALSTHARLLGD